MQHIGIDTRLTYYRKGGISTYMRRIVSALESIDYDNRYTIFHSRKAQGSLAQRFQSAALWTPCHHRLERYAMSAELARFNLDLLHSPDFIPPLRGARHHIVTVHDLNFLHYPQYLTAESRRYYNDQIEFAVQHADHILADSAATKTDLIEMLNVPADKVTVHMLGVDESFRPLRADILAGYQQQLDVPEAFFLFVGTFEPRKNIIGLLQAYQMLREQITDVPPLVLAGQRGWLFDETMQHIEQMNLQQHILWRENVPQEALPALYNLAAAVVLPSYYEGFGFPPLEGMACGTVPIVSNRSSLPEVVGDVGALIDPDDPTTLADALNRVLTDSRWVEANRAAGLKRAALFTWENTARIILSVYNRMS